MLYLLKIEGRFYFNRRIPENYKAYDPRSHVRVSLKTADYKQALRLAMAHNERLESYWNTLIASGQTHSEQHYHALVDRARLLGFSYVHTSVLAELPFPKIADRLRFLRNGNASQIEAVLGRELPPVIHLEQVTARFFELAKDQTFNKSPNQVRKWEAPRKLAMRNFITIVGNKALNELTRDDIVKFRDWWIERVKNGRAAKSANKDLVCAKTMITTVADHLKLELDTAHIFRKLILKEGEEKRRLPFDSDYIRDTLLSPAALADLNEQARWALHAFAETGAGIQELTGLLPEDIILNGDIPHIVIRSRKGRTLKTKFRARVIPLVGYALDAFRACPNGFPNYYEHPDNLSAVVTKYLTYRNLFPSTQHTIYSLRHSFQDRLLAVNTPDRIQADLMGHKFARPRYGDGATLAHKLEWMQKIQLKRTE